MSPMLRPMIPTWSSDQVKGEHREYHGWYHPRQDLQVRKERQTEPDDDTNYPIFRSDIPGHAPVPFESAQSIAFSNKPKPS